MALPNFRVAFTRHGGPPNIRHYAPTAAQTFVKGQVVFLVAANTVTEAIDDETTALGVAMDDALDDNAVLRATVGVALFDGNTIFSGDNTGTILAMGTHAGDPAELELTAGEHAVGVATAGNGLFVIEGADPTDAATAGGDRVLVNVEASESQVAGYGTAPPI